jgi:hypothetical protein
LKNALDNKIRFSPQKVNTNLTTAPPGFCGPLGNLLSLAGRKTGRAGLATHAAQRNGGRVLAL